MQLNSNEGFTPFIRAQTIIETLALIIIFTILFAVCIWSGRMTDEFNKSFGTAREFIDLIYNNIKQTRDPKYHELFRKNLYSNESIDTLAKVIREHEISKYQTLNTHNYKTGSYIDRPDIFHCNFLDKRDKVQYYFIWDTTGNVNAIKGGKHW